MTAPDAANILQALLAGRVIPAEAARQLLAISGSAGAGLTIDPDTRSPADAARLLELMRAVRWEMARIMVPGQLPDAPYDSPEYHAWISRAPGGRPGQRPS